MPNILAINAGSSSIKLAVFRQEGVPRVIARATVDGLAAGRASIAYRSLEDDAPPVHDRLPAASGQIAGALTAWLDAHGALADLAAVGHRIVHGMEHLQPEVITPGLMSDLTGAIPFDPEHLPLEIALVEAVGRRLPGLPQVACFDTGFHSRMPRLARILPIPRRYEAQGIRRYGFHGLSYAYLLHELERLGDKAAVRGRVVLAHLGSGASMAAVRDGCGVDTSMGFTPSAGLPMGTRAGDLDPGLAGVLARVDGLTMGQFEHLVNHQCGLLGISETSADVRDLLASEGRDARAAEAVDYFCYQAKKQIGAYAAVLGGLDTLVFSGGIGQHQPAVRARICADLDFLGIELDAERNERNEGIITRSGSRVAVRVIPTDEESMIVRHTLDRLAH